MNGLSTLSSDIRVRRQPARETSANPDVADSALHLVGRGEEPRLWVLLPRECGEEGLAAGVRVSTAASRRVRGWSGTRRYWCAVPWEPMTEDKDGNGIQLPMIKNRSTPSPEANSACDDSQEWIAGVPPPQPFQRSAGYVLRRCALIGPPGLLWPNTVITTRGAPHAPQPNPDIDDSRCTTSVLLR